MDLALNNLQRLISATDMFVVNVDHLLLDLHLQSQAIMRWYTYICFKQIYLTHKWDPNSYYHWLRVGLGIMAMIWIGWVLWYINYCRLFNVKFSLYMIWLVCLVLWHKVNAGLVGIVVIAEGLVRVWWHSVVVLPPATFVIESGALWAFSKEIAGRMIRHQVL